MSSYSELINASLNNTLSDDEFLQSLVELISANPSIKDEALSAIEVPFRTGRLSADLYEKINAAIKDNKRQEQTEVTRFAGQASDTEVRLDQDTDATIVTTKSPTPAPDHHQPHTPVHGLAPHEQSIEEYKATLKPLSTPESEPASSPSEDETFINLSPTASQPTGASDNNAELLQAQNAETIVAETIVNRPSEPSINSETIAAVTTPQQISVKPARAEPSETTTITESTEQAKELKPGSIIKGRFVLEEILGQGGMGVVYKARDLRKEEAQDRNPHVAIKVLGAAFKDHPQSLIALQREARKAQTLAHPNIVTVYDFDRDGDTVYMTMEYLEGDALDRMLKRLKPNAMEKTKAIPIIEGICNGLAYAHKHNIIHSDLKPGNIFVTHKGDVKVFDFGIARAMKPKTDNKGETTVFDAGSLGGLTPAYASLEMLEGDEPDLRDDIYALACIAFELLGGQHPFNKLPADQAKARNLTPPLIKNLSRQQYKALLKGIAFERDARTATVKQFNADISGQRNRGKLVVVAVLAGILLITLVTGPLQQYLTNQKTRELVGALTSGNENTITFTLSQLAEADSNLREKVLSQAKDDLILYYKKQAEQEINVQQNNYNFEKAHSLLSKAQTLFPDSEKIATIIETIESRKNRLLNDLTTRFNAQLDAGQFLPSVEATLETTQSTHTQNTIFDTIKTVAAIDAKHRLLSDPQLKIKISAKANQAAEARQFDTAKALLSAAIEVFPYEAQLVDLQDQIRIYEQNYLLGKLTVTPQQSQKPPAELSIADRQNEIERLLNSPFSSTSWSGTLARQLDYVIEHLPGNDPWLKNKRNYIAELYFRQALSRRDAKRYSDASVLIQHAQRWDPSIPGIKKELLSITQAKQTLEQQRHQQARKAKINGLKQTLLTQTKADDVIGAKESYNALKNLLSANDNYIKETAPREIGNAYLRLANGFAKRDQYPEAIKLVDAGLVIAPNMASLKDAEKRYQTAISEQEARSVAIANDPCKPSFAGHGKRSKATCSDTINANQSGPKLVVVPAGQFANKPFAIGKYEVSIKQYNQYCQLSKACQTINASKTSIPVTNISLKQATAFTDWLSQTTGYTYRLPTLEEWRYAAKANGNQPKKDFNCRVVNISGRVVKGSALIDVTTGKKNGWGLTNYVGNAQEWVTMSTASGKLKVNAVGGAYKDSLTKCEIMLTRDHNGKADEMTGFRVLRELI